jgi:MtaA/CmuA family methyltransferase
MNGYERIRACIDGKPLDAIPFMPITMMFAADHIGAPYGRYAADYRLLVEGQLRAAEDYDFDFVSCISDPAREAADCGAPVVWFDNQPPALDEGNALLADKAALAALKQPDPLGGGRMTDRVNAAALFREKTGGDKLIEGWVEGPIALAADLRGINHLMMDFFEEPDFVRELMAFAVETGLAFAKAQIEAGADIIGVGDAAASLVGPMVYDEYVWQYEKQLVDGIHAAGGMVRLHICGNTSPILEGMGRLGCEIVDLDHMVSMADARAAMGPGQVLLGNIDPVSMLRNGTPENIRAALTACHAACGERYIVSAGCEVVRDTPLDNLRAMRDYARNQKGA